MVFRSNVVVRRDDCVVMFRTPDVELPLDFTSPVMSFSQSGWSAGVSGSIEWIREDLNLGFPPCKGGVVGRAGPRIRESARPESNGEPIGLQPIALPIELRAGRSEDGICVRISDGTGQNLSC